MTIDVLQDGKTIAELAGNGAFERKGPCLEGTFNGNPAKIFGYSVEGAGGVMITREPLFRFWSIDVEKEIEKGCMVALDSGIVVRGK